MNADLVYPRTSRIVAIDLFETRLGMLECSDAGPAGGVVWTLGTAFWNTCTVGNRVYAQLDGNHGAKCCWVQFENGDIVHLAHGEQVRSDVQKSGFPQLTVSPCYHDRTSIVAFAFGPEPLPPCQDLQPIRTVRLRVYGTGGPTWGIGPVFVQQPWPDTVGTLSIVGTVNPQGLAATVNCGAYFEQGGDQTLTLDNSVVLPAGSLANPFVYTPSVDHAGVFWFQCTTDAVADIVFAIKEYAQ